MYMYIELRRFNFGADFWFRRLVKAFDVWMSLIGIEKRNWIMNSIEGMIQTFDNVQLQIVLSHGLIMIWLKQKMGQDLERISYTFAAERNH